MTFLNILKNIQDKRPIWQNVSEFRLGYLSSPFWKKNVNILASVKVRILECAVKDIFYTCGVKHERKRGVKEFGMN